MPKLDEASVRVVEFLAARNLVDEYDGTKTHTGRVVRHIEEQSARIVELEAENKAMRRDETRNERDDLRLRVRELEAERDAMRKALEWMYRRREVAFVGDTLEHCLAVSDGTGTSIEAALLAAAREGGAL